MTQPLLRIVDNQSTHRHTLPTIDPAPGFGDKAVTHGTTRTYLSAAKQVRAWARRAYNCNHLLPHQGTAENLLSQYIHHRMSDPDNSIKDTTALVHLSAMAWRYRVYVRRLHRWCGYQDGLNPITKAHHELVEQWAIRQANSPHHTPTRTAQALSADDLFAMIATCEDTLCGKRDKALLLLGFAGGLRRSELVNLHVTDITINTDGLMMMIRKSKTDTKGKGTRRFIVRQPDPTACPVVALSEFLTACRMRGGYVFRMFRKGDSMQRKAISEQSVALIVKRYAKAVGIPPNRVSGHSLRRGMATEARSKGHSTLNIQHQGGWSSPDMPGHYASDADMTKPENNASYRILERATTQQHNTGLIE